MAAAVELECSDRSALNLAEKPGFLKRFARCNLVGSEAADGIAFGNDPAAASSRGDEKDMCVAVRIDVNGKAPNCRNSCLDATIALPLPQGHDTRMTTSSGFRIWVTQVPE
jgi:hypothetical protein